MINYPFSGGDIIKDEAPPITLDIDLDNFSDKKRKAMRNKYLHDENITPAQRKEALFILETLPGPENMAEAQRVLTIMADTHIGSDANDEEEEECCSKCGDGYLADNTLSYRADFNTYTCSTCYEHFMDEEENQEIELNDMDEEDVGETCEGCGDEHVNTTEVPDPSFVSDPNEFHGPHMLNLCPTCCRI